MGIQIQKWRLFILTNFQFESVFSSSQEGYLPTLDTFQNGFEMKNLLLTRVIFYLLIFNELKLSGTFQPLLSVNNKIKKWR